MKPGFALDLDEDHIRLLFRRADGWVKVGEVGFADPKLGDKLAALRQKAGRLAPEGVLTKLVIPSSQILYTEVDAPGPDRRARRAQIMKAIDGRTPYALDELTVDWARSGKHTFVAVVAKLTLDEAEDFAEGFGFNPVSFVAIPESGRFDGEPFFGQTRNAEAHLPAGEPLDRDTAPIRIVGALPDEALEPEPAAGTATEMEAPAADETARLPESGPEEAAEKAPEAATDTPGQDPDRNAETATADEPRPAAMPPASRTPRSETPPSETAPSETAPSETPPSKTAASGTPVAEAPAEHRPEIAPEIAPAIAPDLGRKQSRAEIAAQSLGAVGDRRIAADDDEAPFIEVAEGTADPEPPIAAGASFASRRELRAPLDRGGDGPAPLKGAAASRLTFAEPALPEPVTRRVGPATAKPGVTAPDLAVPEASGADGAEDSQQPPRRNRLGPPIVDVKHEARHGTLAQQKQRRVSELGEDPDTAFTSFGTTRDPRRAGGLRPKLILTLLLLLLLALGAIALWSMRSTTSDPAASLAPARSPLPDAASTGASSGESDLAATTTGDAAPDAAQTESAPAPMAQPSLTAAAPEADAPPEVNPPPAAAETLEAAAPAPAPAPAPAGAASVAPQPEAITG
ncbi:MAG: hypothetical protein KDD88_03070, partial [Rhodobacteraceae bacterium]|nr:hypothetical protein [Paracoccaceae bacterium]